MVTRQRNAPPPPVVNGHDDSAAAPQPEDDIIVDDLPDGAAAPASAAAEEDPAVKSLREQLEESNRRAAEAEQRLQAERAERGKDQTVLQDSRLLVIESTITTKETEREAIKQRIREAKEAGDYEAEANALAELADNATGLHQAKIGKDRLEQDIEAAKNGPRIDPNADPVEQYIAATPSMPPRSQKWLREHPDFVTDPDKNSDLVAAHYSALGQKIIPNSADYFKHLEEKLGLRQADAAAALEGNGGGQRQQAQQQDGGLAPAAPVSRSANAGGGYGKEVFPGIIQSGPNKYSIANNEQGRAVREAAQMSGVTVAEYVAQAVKLQRGSDGQLH